MVYWNKRLRLKSQEWIRCKEFFLQMVGFPLFLRLIGLKIIKGVKKHPDIFSMNFALHIT
jgi:hypothetical protein